MVLNWLPSVSHSLYQSPLMDTYSYLHNVSWGDWINSNLVYYFPCHGMVQPISFGFFPIAKEDKLSSFVSNFEIFLQKCKTISPLRPHS